MIKFIRATVRGIKMALAADESGWMSLTAQQPWSAIGGTAKSGKIVSPETAMTLSAVWACVTRTSQLISTLPLAVYEKQSDGSREKITDDLSQILTVTPNSGQTSVEFWEGMVAHMTMRGNSYAEKQYIGPRVVALRPLLNATPERTSNGEFKYAIIDRGQKTYLPATKVFHLRGFGSGDGLGMSAVRYGLQSMGSALAADESAARIFSNGMMAAGVVSSEQTLKPEQRVQLGDMLEAYVGSDRAGKILMLEAGLTYNQLQMNPDDAQLLETRRFQVEDVCRWFGVPPIIIGHSGDGQTMWGTGVEAIMLSWLTTGINPLLTRIEARINKDLLLGAGHKRRYVEFNREAMLQMDSAAKGDFLLKMRMGGFMSGDEGRDKLNLPRRGGANDDLIVQTSLAPVDLLGKDKK